MDNESLFSLMYEELRALAGNVFAQQKSSHTLQPTALINEVWIKLSGNIDQVKDRPHFFALASRAMRQVLTDHARMNHAEKRSGNNY